MEPQTNPVQPQNQPVVPSNDPVPPASQPASAPAAVPPAVTVESAPQPQAVDLPIGLTGSMMPEQKTPVPIGIYILAGLMTVSLGISFFDSSQYGAVASVALIIDMLLTAGVLFRLEGARRLLIVMSSITLVLVALSALLSLGLQSRLKHAKADLNAALSEVEKSPRLTAEQQEQINTIRADVKKAEEAIGRGMTVIYIKLGVNAVIQSVVIVYLSRPKVKKAFRTAEV